jgi:hypothetical protein
MKAAISTPRAIPKATAKTTSMGRVRMVSPHIGKARDLGPAMRVQQRRVFANHTRNTTRDIGLQMLRNDSR